MRRGRTHAEGTAVRLLLDAGPLGWRPCGTRSYVAGLLDGFAEAGLDRGLDVLTARGYARRTVVPAPAFDRTSAPPQMTYAWAWEQVTSRSAGDVLFRPYSEPARRRDHSFALLDVLSWLPGDAAVTPVGRAVARLVRTNAKRADLVVAISEFSRLEAIEHLGLQPDRVHTVLLAPGRVFRPDAPTPPGIALPSSPYVVHAGGYGRRKRPDALLRAFAADPSLARDVSVVLVGSPPDDLVATAEGTGVRVVTVPGASDEHLAALYAHAGASAYFSEYEGFGLPPVEALAAGCPVVASDLPPLHEAAGDAPTYVDHDDPDAVAGALRRALDGPRPSIRAARTWADVARETWALHRERWPTLG